MDSEVLPNNAAQPARRTLTRQSARAVSIELTPRGPLKRKRRGAENKIPSTTVNGKEIEEASDDESPNKKSKSDIGVDCSSDEDEMDVLETDEDQNMGQNEDHEMIAEEDSYHHVTQQKRSVGKHQMGDINLPKTVRINSTVDPTLYLRSRRSIHPEGPDTECLKAKRVEPSRRGAAGSTKSATQLRPLENRPEVLTFKRSSMSEYKEKMEGKAKAIGISGANHCSVNPISKVSHTLRPRVNNIPTQKETSRLPKQDIKKKKKSADCKGHSGSSSRGCIWMMCQVLILLASVGLGVLCYQNLPVRHGPAGGDHHPAWPVKPGEFLAQFSALEALFPSQRSELWRRSRIHLEGHLQTAQPTEPVSLILTAGRRAEKTLHCLAHRLASAYSSTLNASVLHIEGASKATQDSDEVKLDIDGQLRDAFEGDKPVAIIHRFEELPPGSTLIFYRYCDHENAAYKRVFLLFTVLLPEEQVGEELSLNEVEEKVQDYIHKRLLGSDSQASFNTMDMDKFGGLWSRISHLILPVAAEERIEQTGCND